MTPLSPVLAGADIEVDVEADESLMLCEANVMVVKVDGDADVLKEPPEDAWLVLDAESPRLERIPDVLIGLVLAPEEVETEADDNVEVGEDEAF